MEAGMGKNDILRCCIQHDLVEGTPWTYSEWLAKFMASAGTFSVHHSSASTDIDKEPFLCQTPAPIRA